MGVGGEIIQEQVASLASEDGGLSLIVGDFVESRENRGIDSTSIVEESAGYRLDALGVFFVQRRGRVTVSVLNFLAIDGLWALSIDEERAGQKWGFCVEISPGLWGHSWAWKYQRSHRCSSI